MRTLIDRYRRHRARLSRGQSLTEFAIFLPVLLLIVLVALDFGRIYLGWVNLQQMARLAASFAAEHASAWVPPGDATDQGRYETMVRNDALFINCDMDTDDDGTLDVPDPILGGGTALGAPVTVNLECEFPVITPIISDIVGGTVLVGASVTYPVKEGAVAEVAGGGIPIVPVPVADFIGTPRSGWAPLDVTYIDTSTSSPTSWSWDFSVNPTGPGAAANPGTSQAQTPPTVTYDCTGNPGDVCTFEVRLRVQNQGGTDTKSVDDYVTVTVPPANGPIAEFTGTPRTGTEPLTVAFQFVDLRGGSVTYSGYQWDFGDGGTSTQQNPTHQYPNDGAYDVRLRVTEAGTGATNALTKVGYIVVSNRICTVPDIAGSYRRNQASQIQQRWTDAGFTGTITYLPGPNNYRIQYQLPVGGVVDPQPDGCASNLTLGP
jgi:PKD repeat protein